MIKSFKKFPVIFSIILVLFIAIGSISASENITGGSNFQENLEVNSAIDTGDYDYGLADVESDGQISREVSVEDINLSSQNDLEISSNSSNSVDKSNIENGTNQQGSSVIKLSTKVYAPVQIVEHGKNNYYEIKVWDIHNNPVKNIVLKVKVFTGKKAKNYWINTNSKGIAKLITKNLALGTHIIRISTIDKKYKVLKYSKVIVKTPVNVKLKSLNYYPYGKGCKVILTWYAKKGYSYKVFKKTTGKYRVIANVNASGSTASYTEKVKKGQLVTYTVRQSYRGRCIGSYDSQGLSLLNAPYVDVDFKNVKAEVKWSHVKGATKYLVFRKIGHYGKFKCIAILDAKQTEYRDWYYKFSNKLGKLLQQNKYLDPSNNNLFYTVRACNFKEIGGVKKVSYGLYLKKGDFHLEAPTIISLKGNKMTWGWVPNADGYMVFKKSESNSVWKKIAITPQKSTTQISLNIGKIDKNAYYTVLAYANKNGKIVYSNYDRGFTLKNYAGNNLDYRILYIGDSITYGAPYSSIDNRHIFSMPYRIAQLTGCVYYNPSIPGSTYHDLGVDENGTNIGNKYRITRDIVDAIEKGQYPGNWRNLDSAKNSEGVTNTTLTDYNIVVLSAGINDYHQSTQLGSIDEDSNNTFTFNGALNYILEKVKNASDFRVNNGSTPIKVVFVDLFYSGHNRTSDEPKNWDVTPNKIGLTLKDYQNALNDQLLKWEDAGLEVFNFHTRDYKLVNQFNCQYTTTDDLHCTKFTYGQYGNAIAQFLVDNVFN